MGNRSNGTSNVNTNENAITINEPKEEQPRININEASQSALETLPGIDTKLAQDIIENRPYTSPWDLLEVDGIGENTVRGLLDYFSAWRAAKNRNQKLDSTVGIRGIEKKVFMLVLVFVGWLGDVFLSYIGTTLPFNHRTN